MKKTIPNVGWSINRHILFGKLFREIYSYPLGRHTFWPNNSILGIYPTEKHSPKHMYIATIQTPINNRIGKCGIFTYWNTTLLWKWTKYYFTQQYSEFHKHDASGKSPNTKRVHTRIYIHLCKVQKQVELICGEVKTVVKWRPWADINWEGHGERDFWSGGTCCFLITELVTRMCSLRNFTMLSAYAWYVCMYKCHASIKSSKSISRVPIASPQPHTNK